MHEDIHIQLTSRHIAFIVGLIIGFLFWSAQVIFANTIDLGVTAINLPPTPLVATTSAMSTSAMSTTPTTTPTTPTPLPAPSPLHDTTPPRFNPGEFRVGLQVGHLNNQNPPSELRFIARNTGSVGAGTTEPAVANTIAQQTKRLLEAEGVQVDILPAVVPPGYQADAFVSIHTDGSEKPYISGYKAAPSAYDQSGKAALLSNLIEQEYEKSTGMNRDDKITENMTHYYSFAHRRVGNSISPYTPGILLETGFLTSPQDQQIIVYQPEKSARGLANGLMTFLTNLRQ